MTQKYLGRKIFLSDWVGFFEEIFCLSDGEEHPFYQIVRGRSVYRISPEVGAMLEEAILTDFDEEIAESMLISYSFLLSKEVHH
jgi:hypothetical protein